MCITRYASTDPPAEFSARYHSGMPRQAVSVESPSGVEWAKATVDAPDAYYDACRVQLVGRTVTVFNRTLEVGRYELDDDTSPAAGVLAGTVDDVPLTVKRGCNCGTPYSKTLKQTESEGT